MVARAPSRAMGHCMTGAAGSAPKATASRCVPLNTGVGACAKNNAPRRDVTNCASWRYVAPGRATIASASVYVKMPYIARSLSRTPEPAGSFISIATSLASAA